MRARPCERGIVAATDTSAIVPPQNLEAEESVLGAMMVSEAAIEPVILDVRLQEDDFYRDRHRKIFKAIIDLCESDGAVDVLTVTEALDAARPARGDRAAATSSPASPPVSPPPATPATTRSIVKQNALMRRLDAAAKMIQQSVAERDGEPNEMVENAERLLFQVAHEEKAADFKSLEDVLHSEWDRLTALHENKTALIGTPSGFKELDDKTGGFQNEQPDRDRRAGRRWESRAIVCNIAENAAVKNGKTVALFSLEMSEIELAQRFLASQARISSDPLRKGTVSKRLAEGGGGQQPPRRGAAVDRRLLGSRPARAAGQGPPARRPGARRGRELGLSSSTTSS